MRRLRILVLEDELRLLEELSEYLEGRGFDVLRAGKPSEAEAAVSSGALDVAIIDLRLPEYSGIEFLKRLKAAQPGAEAIMMSGHGDMESVISAMRHGAFDYLRKPFSPIEIQAAIERTQRFLEARRQAERLESACRALNEEIVAVGDIRFVGRSATLEPVMQRIQAAAEHPESPVLITGESGTGKELVARLIHLKSPRGSGRFRAVNCAAIPAELFESEVFGHRKGAFTGALEGRLGLFRSTEGGTLFLDEIGDLPQQQQGKLLRVLEEPTVSPVGSDEEVAVNVRVICATNQDLTARVEAKAFRLDLYYRLSVLTVRVPPLRERPEDIPVLVEYFTELLARRMGKRTPRIPEAQLEALRAYSFPGNVRELRNMIERAIILGGDSLEVELPGVAAPESAVEPRCPTGPSTPSQPLNLAESERLLIERALEKVQGNRSRAAQLLGISRQALARKIGKSGSDS